MRWALDDAITEWAVDVAAAAICAAAVAFAGWALSSAAAATLFVASGSFLVVCAGLRHLPADEQCYSLPAFRLAPIELTVLELTETAGELVLDDALTSVEPDSRVVQLFDPSRLPPAGGNPGSAPPDASRALSDALAKLRRSLH